MLYFILALFVISFLVYFLFSSVSTVAQQTIAIIERFGKFSRIAKAVLLFKLPFGIEKIASKILLRIQQINIEIETKTKDNVFVQLDLAVQFRADEKKVVDAYYKLARPMD